MKQFRLFSNITRIAHSLVKLNFELKHFSLLKHNNRLPV